MRRVRSRFAGWLLLALLAGNAARSQKLATVTFAVEDGLPSQVILDLAQDGDGRLWILCRGGLTVFDGRTFRPPPRAGEFPGEPPVALTHDQAGRIWVASARTGPQVAYVDRGTWRSLPRPPLREGDFGIVTSLAAAGGDGGPLVLVGSSDAGLLVWDGRGWQVIGREQGLPAADVRRLQPLPGAVAVATSAGLCLFSNRQLDCQPRQVDRRLREPIYAVAAAGDDPSDLWVLGRGWLGRLTDRRLEVVAEGLDAQTYFPAPNGALAVGPEGGIYFGSPGQLHYRQPATGAVAPLGRREGLASEGATAVLVDREANVWIASMRGLTMISSRRFLSFDRGQGLLEDEVSAIAEPAPGRLLLGHNTGFTVMEEGVAVSTIRFPGPVDGPLNSQRVLDLAVGGDGITWAAATGRGLLRLSTDGRWRSRRFDSAVMSVELDAGGTLWVATRERLYSRRPDGTFADHPFPQLTRPRWLYLHQGTLYLATTAGLRWYDGERWHRAAGPRASANNVYGVLVTAGGAVWVGTGAGLYELRDGRLAAVEDPLLERPVYALRQGPPGEVWLGTDDGVWVWDGETLRQLTVRHGLAGREVNRGALWLDQKGRIWIGTDRGLSVYRRRFDRRPAAPPRVLLRGIEALGKHLPATADLHLSHRQNHLVFLLETIAFSHHEGVRYRYRLDGFDRGWQEDVPVAESGIRYTNLEPGRYRFHVAARWADGDWGPEAASAAIVIARPLWREPSFLAAVGLALAGIVLGLHRLLTRALRRRAQQLAAINARLQETIAEKARAEAERERLIAELEAKNAELERFTYSVSHDLKSPLVTIKGFLGFLRKDVADGNLERAARDLELIRGAAETMGQLLDELLELSRVGHQQSPPEPIPLDELVQEAVDLVAMRLAARGIEVEVAPELPAVVGERRRLRELLQNLIDNAAKFMGEQTAPRIEIGARRVGGEVTCYVRDNGMGIEPHYQTKIFGLFERLHPYIDGTGIGLTLAKRIVETHGGRIWVESAGRGQGATFYFTLPAA